MNDIQEILVPEEADGERIDIFVSAQNNKLSRSRVQKIVESRLLTVNGQPVRKNSRLKAGDVIRYSIPDAEEVDLSPEPIPIEILYSDRDIVVINKPQGLVVHPAPGNLSGTLVNALLYHCESLSEVNGSLRPGIVHRLDKDTSGVMVVAKNDFAHNSLAEQIKDHMFKRIYIALVNGQLKHDKGIIDAPIGRNPHNRKKMAVVFENSKQALTRFTVLERFKKHTLVELKLETGRTHQIRVHMSYLGHPVVGDDKYGRNKNNLGFQGQALHAILLGFNHPRSGKYIEFSVEPPKKFQQVLEKFRKGIHLCNDP